MKDLTVCLLLGLTLFAVSLNGNVRADVGPSENECRPYIEKAINELKTVEPTDEIESVESPDSDPSSLADDAASIEDDPVETTSVPEEDDSKEGNDETVTAEEVGDSAADDGSEEKAENDEDSKEEGTKEDEQSAEDVNETEEKTESDENAAESTTEDDDDSSEKAEGENGTEEDAKEDNSTEVNATEEQEAESGVNEEENADDDDGDDSVEKEEAATEDNKSGESEEKADDDDEQSEENKSAEEEAAEDGASEENATEEAPADSENVAEETDNSASEENASTEATVEDNTAENVDADEDSTETEKTEESENASEENTNTEENTQEESAEGATEAVDDESDEEANKSEGDDTASTETETVTEEATEDDAATEEKQEESTEEEASRTKREVPEEQSEESVENVTVEGEASAEEASAEEVVTAVETEEAASTETEEVAVEAGSESVEVAKEEEVYPEDDLLLEFEIPKNLRDRSHVTELLRLDDDSSNKENAIQKQADVILRDLKRIYDNAIKPLETLYKYRDLSNRHFGDPEIFSKPLVLFMGPWSGGKSTILNYLTENEYTPNSVRSGAEPSPAYFNILMHGDEPEVLDGTQLAADWTFSGLQKFGQGLLDRLRGQRLPNKLLEKVNIVEIPGILEVRKHVSRYFPFNDACQWFIDRADIIFLVYDPSKLDVGPETEAILDQLKGREYQTRILLNKADQVKPEELLRVQGALIWNISPLMSSAQPPVMYTVSLWSHPYEIGSPSRLLQAQERAFLRDLRDAIDKRIENKISSARRFAVRVRNHAKMVDCYLTTYYNHKTIFGNKKAISNQIIEHPQNYHIYEGLSTLTNISRYDLPDPEVYRDFFRLNPLFEFKKLSETCTYFRGCPINKLDIAIAYDLPDLGGKYKKLSEQVLSTLESETNPSTTESTTTTTSPTTTPTRKS